MLLSYIVVALLAMTDPGFLPKAEAALKRLALTEPERMLLRGCVQALRHQSWCQDGFSAISK